MKKFINFVSISAEVEYSDGYVRAVKILSLASKKSISSKLLENLKFSIDDLQGTPFQKSVWKQIAKIPFGHTITYGELAQKIKKPKAVRAVAQACSKNPIPLVVPCHRVVAANGLGASKTCFSCSSN